MITRTIGRIARGNATPFQLFAACILGSLLGFAPEPVSIPVTIAAGSIPRVEFDPALELEPGLIIEFATEEGETLPGTILEFNEDEVRVFYGVGAPSLVDEEL